ncbi:hypothetical protein JYU34_015758 [Plutella xylostella]|uniref:Uncharacterized protein n=1 Tax=Plutella xylostella TaxID=51655 RepID=A0ABQ7Q4Y8_PLUXY|nr:hypothetical protein JYU34_015758 [Plutella xylostella]
MYALSSNSLMYEWLIQHLKSIYTSCVEQGRANLFAPQSYEEELWHSRQDMLQVTERVGRPSEILPSLSHCSWQRFMKGLPSAHTGCTSASAQRSITHALNAFF